MNKLRLYIYIFIIFLFSTPFWAAKRSYVLSPEFINLPSDSIDTVINSDTFNSGIIKTDSLPTDSGYNKKTSLDATVDYQAEDSMVFTANNWGYMYGSSEVYYTTLSLKAENIKMDMDNNLVTAIYGTDSIGEKFGYPRFTQGKDEYESESMYYNFKTKKAIIKHTVTQEGEGFVVADSVKMNPDNTFFLKNGQYTTCDDHDHPHFYVKLTKGKMNPKKNVVFGPAYLVIEDLPLPFIGLPFGFFPMTSKYSSGVLMPSYVDDLDRGFGLHNGGYYFAINDYVDLSLTGEAYTRGTWGLNLRSSYKKRYKYTGNLDLGYLVTKLGEKGIDRTVSRAMRINWSHSQDSKANMFRTLSASVNYESTSFTRNQLNSLGTPGYTSSNRGSTVTMTQRIPNSAWSFSASVTANQSVRDSTISLTLPQMSVNMSRVFPFKQKEKMGTEKWFEKIYMSYTGDIRNSITTKDDKLFDSDLQRDWQNGMKHSIPIGANFSVLDYINITPTANYTERWYLKKVSRAYDYKTNSMAAIDTTYGFHRVYDFNFNVSLQTKMYGMYKPLLMGNKIEAIRHVFTPSITYSYAPDFSNPKWGSYDSYTYYTANGEKKTEYYSPYQAEIFGTAPKGMRSALNFSFENNLEMKWKTSNDSVKKISLIDNLGINFSYNMAADSLKLSDISTNVRLKLSKNLTVNVSAQFDPYMYDPVFDSEGKITGLNKVDRLRMSHGSGIARLRSTGYSISPSINQDTFKKWFGGKASSSDDKLNKNSSGTELQSSGENGSENGEKKSMFAKKKDDQAEFDEDGYLKNEVKWNLSFNYSMNYAYDSRIDIDNLEYKRKLTHNFGFSGSIQPTKNWNFNFSANYDFQSKKLAYSTFSLTRNLHCWSISANFTPSGAAKFFYVKLSATSQLLQDLKYEKRKRSSSLDPTWD